MAEGFRFKASAVGASGYFTIPFTATIDVSSTSALSSIGGYDAARSADFRFREILQFDLARTEVIGSHCTEEEGGSVHVTSAKASIENLNVMDMVTADRVVANLVSTYPGDTPNEPSVRLLGSRFENLRIAGVPVDVILCVDTLDQYDTFAGLREAYPNVDRVRELFGTEALKARVREAPARISRWFNPAPAADRLPAVEGVCSTSIVRELKPQGSGLDCYGHVIHIKGFGTIRLGEVQISRLTRTVTMMQIDFCCPLKGAVCFCIVEDGGSPPW